MKLSKKAHDGIAYLIKTQKIAKQFAQPKGKHYYQTRGRNPNKVTADDVLSVQMKDNSISFFSKDKLNKALKGLAVPR